MLSKQCQLEFASMRAFPAILGTGVREVVWTLRI